MFINKIIYLSCSLFFTLFFSNPLMAYERIISLKPNITEILYELGVGDKIVADTTYCNNPPPAKLLPKVADYIHADIEKIVSLKPDLIFDSEENNVKGDIDFLRSRNIDVMVLSFRTLTDFMHSIQNIAKKVGKEAEGEAMIDRIQKGIASFKNQLLPSARAQKILIVVGVHPLVVVGGNNFLDDILSELSLSSLASKSPMRYPTWSTEDMIAKQPTVIFDGSMGTEAREAHSAIKWYEQYTSIPAVKNKRIYFLNMDDFRPSSRILVGVKKLVDDLNE